MFPTEHAELEELVNLDKFESVSYYLTGIEYIIKYLLRHRTKLEQDGSPVPDRIKTLLTGFRLFLRSPAWKTQRSRQGVVLWALRYSQLPSLVKKMTHEKQIPQDVGENLLRALREAIVVLERGYLTTSSAGVERVATQGARLALSLIQNTLQDVEPPSQSRALARGAVFTPTGDRKHTRSLRTYLVIDFCFSCSVI